MNVKEATFWVWIFYPNHCANPENIHIEPVEDHWNAEDKLKSMKQI